jgi:hypothetical protein
MIWFQLGVVVHACNPNYRGRWKQEDLEFKARVGKDVSESSSHKENQTKKWLGVWLSGRALHLRGPT